MPSDGHLAGRLLLRLADEGNKPGSTLESKFRKRILVHLQKAAWAPSPHFDKSKIWQLPYDLGKSSVNLLAQNTPPIYIPLRPVVKGDLLLPYLSVVADATLSEFRLLLLMFTVDNQAGTLKNGILRSVGFRFESPESEKGRHNYWHVQLTSSFKPNGGEYHPSTPSWLPNSSPAIPLDACSAASCVVALAVALYGSFEAAQLVHNLRPRISTRAVQRLKNEVRALRSSNRS